VRIRYLVETIKDAGKHALAVSILQSYVSAENRVIMGLFSVSGPSSDHTLSDDTRTVFTVLIPRFIKLFLIDFSRQTDAPRWGLRLEQRDKVQGNLKLNDPWNRIIP
jgi:hypothetical protein